jgi:uncharacterized protein
MAEVATKVRETGMLPLIKKRWRAWLRAFHRDFGYAAIGFTVIYAVSGIAQNHIEDWGDVSYRTFEASKTITPIPDNVSDEQAIATITGLVDFGKPASAIRAGDEIRLEYANGSKVTAIGSEVTIQGRERRAFIGAANWLHTARNKKGWKYVADVYAALLLYLAISGIFMIKGKLGLKWRGAILITAGVAVPMSAVLLSGPGARATATDKTETATSPATPAGSGIKFLPPDEAPEPVERDGSAAATPATKPEPATPSEPAPTGEAGSGDAKSNVPPTLPPGIKFLPPESD